MAGLTKAEIIEAAPKFYNPGRNWSGQCEAAAWNLFDVLGTSGPSSASATIARLNSKIEGKGYGPGGNVVWMSNVWGIDPITKKSTDFGHVCYHIGGGLAFMASSSVTNPISGFQALGFVDLDYYLRKFPAMRMEGWSWDHRGSIAPKPKPIPKPLPPVITYSQEETDMRIVNIQGAGISLSGPGGVTPIYTPEDVGLLVRWFNAKNSLNDRETFYPEQLDRIVEYIAKVA